MKDQLVILIRSAISFVHPGRGYLDADIYAHASGLPYNGVNRSIKGDSGLQISVCTKVGTGDGGEGPIV